MLQTESVIASPKGFTAAGVHGGLKKDKTALDLALIVSDVPAKAAATYTKNVVKAAPLHVSKEHLADGTVQAVIANSGNANSCAPHGEENAKRMCETVGEHLGIDPNLVAVSSTGVIGVSMTPKMDEVKAGIKTLCDTRGRDPQSAQNAAKAIMTTDLTKKECAKTVLIGGKEATVAAIAKGSGMIHPNMGTMLCFITTDVNITQPLLQTALSQAVNRSFNCISVDGDSSTNDFCLAMANGLAENEEIATENEDYKAFYAALLEVCIYLARAIAADGEGATHLITCTVAGAKSEESAANIARSVISSSLVKSAVFGRDANWGRILCAMGYSGEAFSPEGADIFFASDAGTIQVCQKGRGLDFDEELALAILTPHEVQIQIHIEEGGASATCWGCDLTYDYVKINGEYRS